MKEAEMKHLFDNNQLNYTKDQGLNEKIMEI